MKETVLAIPANKGQGMPTRQPAKRIEWRRTGILTGSLFMAITAFPAGVAAAGCPGSMPGQSEAAQAGARVKAQTSALAASGEPSARGVRQSEPRSHRFSTPDSPLPTVSPRERTGQVGKQLAQARHTEHSLTPVGLRDPFKAPPPPVVASESLADLKAEASHLPGPRGLVISQLKLEGIVREEENHDMIAVVTNATNLAYFLREHEPVYDGVVTKIAPDAVYFQENIRDPDRGATSREVVLRLGPAPGVAR